MKNLINHVQLIGHLGQTPELKTFDSGSQCCQISLATNERYKDRQGEYQTQTTWHRLVAWGNLAERLAQCAKGEQLAIQGKLSTRSYEDSQGQTRYVTEVIVSEYMSLSPKKEVAAF